MSNWCQILFLFNSKQKQTWSIKVTVCAYFKNHFKISTFFDHGSILILPKYTIKWKFQGNKIEIHQKCFTVAAVSSVLNSIIQHSDLLILILALSWDFCLLFSFLIFEEFRILYVLVERDKQVWSALGKVEVLGLFYYWFPFHSSYKGPW